MALTEQITAPKEPQKADCPSATCSRLDATPRTDDFIIHRGYDGIESMCKLLERDWNRAEESRKTNAALYERALRERDEARERLAVIACDVAAIKDQWLEWQPEGIRMVIANVRRQSNLSENATSEGSPPSRHETKQERNGDSLH